MEHITQPNVNLVTAPTELPIEVDDLKTYLRIDLDEDDTLLEQIIKAATRRVEAYIDMKLITQKWEIYLDTWPYKEKNIWWDGVRDAAISILSSEGGVVYLPFGKVINVEKIETIDNSDNVYLFASSNYVVDNYNSRGRISLRLGMVWPPTVLRTQNGIKITANFGFGSADSVPEDIKLAIMYLSAQMYEHRGDEFPKIPAAAQMLLDNYRRIKVGL